MVELPLLQEIQNVTSTIAEVITNLLSSVFPNNEVIALFGISLLIAFFMKRRYNVGRIEYVMLTLLVFGFSRWAGIGG
jgi:hypothetical protein|tara:strand:- start:467 stop:700 length:234 start_codon:yes stop_codon:yes gene_type:complete